MTSKIVSAEEAVRLIKASDTVATEGFCGSCFPEELAIALKKRFLETGQPRNLTLVYCAGQGDFDTRGLGHLGHEGLIKRAVGGISERPRPWGNSFSTGRWKAITSRRESLLISSGPLQGTGRDISRMSV